MARKRAKTAAKPKPAHLWDQQPDEPDAAFVRFLAYRNLGPGRSIDAAYLLANPATKRSKTQRANGTWTQEAARWDWQARAEAWDVAILLDAGRRVVTRFIAALDRLASKVLSALDDAGLRPESWSQVLESFGVLSGHVQPEAVQRVAAEGAAGRSADPS